MRNHRQLLLALPLVLFIIIGCGIGGATQSETVSEQQSTQPEQADVTSPPADAPTAEPTLVGITVINGNEIVPITFPESQSGNAGDFDSSNILNTKNLIGGDRFTFGRYERPFNANTMDTYFPYIDIVNTFVYQDDTWVYASIVLQNTDENGNLSGHYGVEFDTNLNGKGDYFVIATGLTSTDWVANGVKVYQDSDETVGDKIPTTSDGDVGGNGFETIIFDEGQGNDAELAWVRLAPDTSNTVQFAIKRSLLGGPDARYLVNMWAGNELMDPSKFDINDHFTHEQAGAADRGLENFYPIKAVAEIDNSCRMAVGFKPTGNEPGLCELPTTPNEVGCTVTSPNDPLIARCLASSYLAYWDTATCSCQYKEPPK